MYRLFFRINYPFNANGYFRFVNGSLFAHNYIDQKNKMV